MTQTRPWATTIFITIISKTATLIAAWVIIAAVCFIPWGFQTIGRHSWDGFAFHLYFDHLISYLKTLATGSLGLTAVQKTPVSAELMRVVPRSFLLLTISLLWGTVVGFIIGAISIISRRRWARTGLLGTTFIALSIPDFFLIVVIQTVILIILRAMGLLVLPALGSLTVRGLILPAFTLGILPAAYVARLVSITLEEIERKDFMRTALSKGLSRLETIIYHGLRNIYATTLTSLPSIFGMTVSSLIIVEHLYVFPGLGALTLTAFRGSIMRSVSSPDCTLLAGTCAVFAASYFVLDMVSSLCRMWANPALRNDMEQ